MSLAATNKSVIKMPQIGSMAIKMPHNVGNLFAVELSSVLLTSFFSSDTCEPHSAPLLRVQCIEPEDET
jgi:hypothetical protein